MAKEYVVRLTGEQWAMLLDIIKRLKGTSQKVKRANILLKADANGPARTDAKIAEPLSGWREVGVRPTRTKADWATEMADLLRTRYADAEKVLLACDNLNTHTRGALHEAFPADEARRLVERPYSVISGLPGRGSGHPRRMEVPLYRPAGRRQPAAQTI